MYNNETCYDVCALLEAHCIVKSYYLRTFNDAFKLVLKCFMLITFFIYLFLSSETIFISKFVSLCGKSDRRLSDWGRIKTLRNVIYL